MQKIIVYCDRCGKEMKDTATGIALNNWKLHQAKLHDYTTETVELCPTCQKLFQQFMKAGKNNSTNT